MSERRKPLSATDDASAPSTPHDPDSGWLSIHREILPREKHPLWRGLWSFSLHPVETILRLTDDPSYTGAWKLLLMAIGFASA